jgi:hypothetical protein
VLKSLNSNTQKRAAGRHTCAMLLLAALPFAAMGAKQSGSMFGVEKTAPALTHSAAAANSSVW